MIDYKKNYEENVLKYKKMGFEVPKPEMIKTEEDNPTIGILLCTDTDADVARYSVLHGNEQLFATKYKTYLPTEEQLKAEIESQKAIFEIQHQEKEENNN